MGAVIEVRKKTFIVDRSDATTDILKAGISGAIGLCALAICYVIGNQFCKDCLFYDGGLQFSIGMVSGVFAVAIGDLMLKIVSKAYGTKDMNEETGGI